MSTATDRPPTGGPAVLRIVVAAIVAFLMIIVAMVYDWRTVGHVHKVYIYGGAAFLIETFLVLPLAGTEAWLSAARFSST